MLRGETNYSIEFLVGKTSALDGYLYIVFTSDNTSVHMATVNWETTIYNHKRVDMSLHKEFDCPVFVKSNKPITLALVMTSATPCNGHTFGELSLNQYVPNEMLMDNYQWVTDDDPRFSHRLLFIFQSGTAQFTYFDHLRMDRSYIFTHAKYKSYRDQFLVEFEISPGYHQLYSTRHYKLQAYIFGISNRENYTRSAYMQPVGFIAMHGGPLYECWPTNMNVKGDMIDNDCDNRIDEEIENKLDDDGDGLIDEDRGKTKLTNGQWAIWETWQCESSFDTIKTRTRKCDNPAPKRGGRSCSGQPIAIIELKECTDRCAHIKFMTASTTASHDGSSSSSDASQPKIYFTPTPSKYTIVPTAGSAKYTTDDIRNSTNSTNADSPTSSESTNNISTPINISSTKSVTSANIGTRMSSTLSNLSSTASATASVKSGTTKSSKLSTQTTNVISTTIDQTITLNLNTTSYIPVTEAILYPGMWGQWSVWGCMDNCTVKNVIRTRPCADAPEGPRSFDCPGYAYQFGYETTCNLICATACSDGMWGFNCSKNCPNCENACDKLTGHCIKCKPGYQNPQNHCTEVCPAFTFGYDCLGDCGANCEGHDCIEREHGVCPAIALKKTFIYGLFAILIIPVCILCNLSATKPRYNKEEGTDLRKPLNKTSSPPLKLPQIEQESEA